MSKDNKKGEEVVRYRTGDEVVITGFRDHPRAIVTVDQPRSSEKVHLRDQYDINRHLHVSNLTPLADYLEGEAKRREQATVIATDDNLRDRFRAAFLDYVSQNSLPEGRGRKKALRAAYDSAVAAVPDAGPYIKAARRYAGERLAYVRQAKANDFDGKIDPFRAYTDEEATGHSLLMIGAAVVRQHMREKGRQSEPPVVLPAAKRPVGRPKKEQLPPADAEEQTPTKLELRVELSPEVFTDHAEAIRSWIESRRGEVYVPFPTSSFLESVLGINHQRMNAILQPYLEQGAKLVPTGLGFNMVWSTRLMANAEDVLNQASNSDLQELLRLTAAELSSRLGKKKSPG